MFIYIPVYIYIYVYSYVRFVLTSACHPSVPSTPGLCVDPRNTRTQLGNNGNTQAKLAKGLRKTPFGIC